MADVPTTIVYVAIHKGARTSHFGGPHNAAATAGVIGFTRQVAKELSRHRIHICAVGLSRVHGTPESGALWDYYRESELDRFVNDVPSGRLVSDRDAAYAVLALAAGSPGRFEGGADMFGFGWGI